MRILFVIRSLGTGGAERQLIHLARGLASRGHDVQVAVMYDGGALESEFADGVVNVVRLGKTGRYDTVSFVSRAIAAAKAFRPHVVHGYMSGANELALLLARRSSARCVWGIRVSDQDFSNYTFFRRAVFEVGSRLSRFPDLIISNSNAGRAFHVERGYPQERFKVIHNGIDTARFSTGSGVGWRLQNGVSLATPLIVHAARVEPMKDHETLLQAAVIALRDRPDLRLLTIGDGDDREVGELARKITDYGLSGSVTHQAGSNKLEEAFRAADLVTLCSAFGEGFPNVLGEAMSCGRICATTDVGDAAVVVADTGLVVPTRDAAGLAASWLELISLEPAKRRELEAAARRRVEREFSIDALVQRTELALTGVVS